MNPLILTLLLLMITQIQMSSQTLIAHRGESAKAPENTLAAFRLAWELNADAVELDVHLSEDNRIMVIHDDNTLRTTGINHEVKNSHSDILRSLDAGSFKDTIFKGEKIPFLEEAIEMLPRNKRLVIEIKSGMDVMPWLEKMVKASDKSSRFIFIAFDWDVIVTAKGMFPENPCYWLSSNRNAVMTRLQEASVKKLTGVNLMHMIIDPEIIQKANALGLEVLAWTVDDPKRAEWLLNSGVIAITSNKPSWLRTQLQSTDIP